MVVIELSFSAPNEARLAARPAHREFLARLFEEGKIVASGPWQDDTGALLILDCEREEADRILAEDPYYSTAGVTVTSVRDWSPVYARKG